MCQVYALENGSFGRRDGVVRYRDASSVLLNPYCRIINSNAARNITGNCYSEKKQKCPFAHNYSGSRERQRVGGGVEGITPCPTSAEKSPWDPQLAPATVNLSTFPLSISACVYRSFCYRIIPNSSFTCDCFSPSNYE